MMRLPSRGLLACYADVEVTCICNQHQHLILPCHRVTALSLRIVSTCNGAYLAPGGITLISTSSHCILEPCMQPMRYNGKHMHRCV